MAESFSRQGLEINMSDLTEEDSVLDVLQDILETDRNFYGIVRFLDGGTRNHVIAAHMRNISSALHILRTFMDRPIAPATITMNLDMSGNLLRNFLEPVRVVATPEQIAAAIETDASVVNTNCAICQEEVTTASRIRSCGHCFHPQCISQWLGMNTRCPVCRHDIRQLFTGEQNRNNQ
jgi:hypothetical protein